MDHGTREKDRKSRAYPKDMAIQARSGVVPRMLGEIPTGIEGESGDLLLEVRQHDMVRAKKHRPVHREEQGRLTQRAWLVKRHGRKR